MSSKEGAFFKVPLNTAPRFARRVADFRLDTLRRNCTVLAGEWSSTAAG